jgi:hypothetical protein
MGFWFIARSAAKNDSGFAGAFGPASSTGGVAARFAATGRFAIASISAMREPPEHGRIHLTFAG